MRTIVIVLGGREFAVPQLAIRADAAWRAKVKPLIDPIAELAMASNVAQPTPAALTKLAFASSLFVQPAETLDAVLSYSVALEADRAWIEENAYADEALGALLTLFFGMAPLTQATIGAANHRSVTTSTS